MKNSMIIIAVLIAIVTAGGGFIGGMKYQQAQRSALGGGQFGANGRFVGRAGGSGMTAVRGNITSADANSITVSQRDGSSKIILYSGSTVIAKSATGSASDLKTGETVSAFGTTNPDGSVTAADIQINPTGFGPGGAGMPNGGNQTGNSNGAPANPGSNSGY